MALDEERGSQLRDALLTLSEMHGDGVFTIADLRSYKRTADLFAELNDTAIAEVLSPLVEDGTLVRTDSDVWQWATETPIDESDGAPDVESLEREHALGGDAADPAGRIDVMALFDMLPKTQSGNGLAVIELDVELVAALAALHPSERDVIATQIEAAIKQVLRESRRLHATRGLQEFEPASVAVLMRASQEPA
jgi:hypothetical protein